MRSRNIKPGFFKNEELATLPPLARILFEGLWLLADCKGRLEDRPKRIKAEILPYDKCDVDNLLDVLAESPEKFIIRYSNNGDRYIWVRQFLRHQNPHKNEKASEIPAYGDITKLHEDSSTPRVIDGTTRADSLFSDSLSSESLIPDSTPPAPVGTVDNELVDELLDIAANIKSSEARWRPSRADRVTFTALVERFPPQQLRDELAKFAAYAPQRDYKVFGKTFASWMGRVTPMPMTAARPAARVQRIANARSQLKGGDEAAARALVIDDLEWQEVLKYNARL